MTITLRGLPGMPPEIEAETARSRTHALALVRTGAVVSAAGRDGTLNIWMTTTPPIGWRCERYSFGSTANSTTCSSLADVRRWLKVHFPLLGPQDEPARILAGL